jgi:hypothetical protein
MAAGASVTWTHCSILFEVTWTKTRRVRTNAAQRPKNSFEYDKTLKENLSKQDLKNIIENKN